MSESTTGKRYLIVGATGNVGTPVTAALLDQGEKVRCLVRSEQKANAFRESGAEVVIGDLDRKESLAPAFEGIDTVFLVISTNRNMEQHGKDAIEVAVNAGVERLVRYTAIKTDYDDHMPTAAMQAAIDAELKTTGLRYTHVRPSNYMQGHLVFAPTIQSDSTIYAPWGAGKVGMADVRDIAEATVEVLTSEGHDGKSYSITGPEAISLHEVAAAISEAIGKKVTYTDVPPEAARDSLLSMGLDAWVVDQYMIYFDAFRNGYGEIVTDDFTKLTGRPSRTINDFARDYASAFSPEPVEA